MPCGLPRAMRSARPCVVPASGVGRRVWGRQEGSYSPTGHVRIWSLRPSPAFWRPALPPPITHPADTLPRSSQEPQVVVTASKSLKVLARVAPSRGGFRR